MKYKINDQVPDSEVFQLIDGNPKKFQLHDFLKNTKSILLGMPGAFTSVCSNKHLPSYKENINKIRSKGVDKIFCISVNDPYVMDAWAKTSKVESEIIMLADPYGNFASKLGVLVDKDAKGLGMRSNRYSMIIHNKIIKYIALEEDTGICELSSAENIISKI